MYACAHFCWVWAPAEPSLSLMEATLQIFLTDFKSCNKPLVDVSWSLAVAACSGQIADSDLTSTILIVVCSIKYLNANKVMYQKRRVFPPSRTNRDRLHLNGSGTISYSRSIAVALSLILGPWQWHYLLF